jgi:autotransporter-associated beta strand protein
MKPRILDSARLSYPLAAAIAALLAGRSAKALDGAWLGTSGNWADTGTWSGGIIADGADFTANFTGVDIAADQTITLTAPQTIGNITFTDDLTSSNNLLITGGSPLTLDVASGTPAINVTQTGRTLVVDSAVAGTDGLQKTGDGVLTLTGASVNTFTGGLNANGGILALDHTNLATPTDLVDPANSLQISSGALTLTGKSNSTTSQTFSGTTLGTGANTINISRNGAVGSATLNLGVLTATAGSITTINPTTVWATGVLPSNEVVKVSGITGKTLPGAAGTANWINVNAGLFYRQSASAGAARWVNVDNLGQLAALPVTIAAQGVSGTVTTARQISSANITLTGNAESYGLVVNSNDATRTLNLGTGGYTYTINGILGVNTNKAIIAAGTGGTVVIGAERNLVFNMDNTGGVDVNAPIVDNGGGASSVTIASTIPSGTAGAVSFGGANTYTGATYINRGVLSFTAASPFGTTPGVNGTSGITINEGTVLSSARGGSNPSTTVAAPITLGAGGNTTLRIGQGAGSNTHTFNLNGAIGGTTPNLVFTTTTGSFGNGSSVFVLGAASDFTGDTLITTGNGGNNPVFLRNGVANALPVTTVLTFDQVNGGGTGRNFQYNLNGNNQTLAGLTNGGVVPQVRRMQVTNSSPTPATLTINNTDDYIFGGSTVSTSIGTAGSPTSAQIQGNLALVKNGTGTFTLGGTLAGGATSSGNTHTGDTTVLGGILVLGETISLQNSAFDTGASIAGSSTDGLRAGIGGTGVTTLTLGGLKGGNSFGTRFTTTSGGHDGLTALTLNPGSGVTHTYSGVIGDGAAGMNLIKTGAGTQILSGTNTYTGTTSGSAGALIATTPAALPGYDAAGRVIFNGGTIGVQVGGSGWTTGGVDTLLTNATKNSGTLGIDTTNGNLTQWTPFTDTNFGALGLNKLGANDLTLDQANTFTGTTTVTEGTLTLTNALALQNSALNISGGSVVLSGLTTLTLGGLNGSSTLDLTGITNLTLNAPAGALLSYSGIIADGTPGMTVTKTGPGTQALTGANTYTGTTQIDGGILTFGNKAAKPAATVTAGAAGSIGLGVKAADAAFYSETEVGDLFNSNTLAGFSLDAASGVAIDTTNAGGSFDQTVALTAARSLSKTGSGTLVLSQVNTHSGSTNVLAGTLSLTGSLDGGGAVTTSGAGVLSQTSTGVISGAATFTQGSTGSSSLAGANTYTGVTNVNLGQLAISNPAALGTTDGNTIVASGGRLFMSTAGLSVAEPLTITGTGTTATNGALAFGGGVTGMVLTAPITLGGAARFQADGSTGSTLSGGIDLGANELTINADGGATQTIDTSAITGTGGSLVKSGGGTLVLGVANSHTGTTTVNGGVLRVTGAAALGTTAAGSVVNGSVTGSSGNARIDLSGGVTVTGEAATLNGVGNFIGALTSSSGTNVWAGPVTIGSAGTRLGAAAGTSLEVSGVIDSGVDPHGLVIRTTDLTGVVVLSGANTYLGTTQVLIGKLQLAGGDNRLPVGTALQFASSSTNPDAELDLNGTNQEVAGLSLGGSGAASKNSVNNSSGTLSTLTVNTPAATPSTFAGILKGNLALVKAGADTLTLSGVNTYTGDTLVDGGTLVLADDAQLSFVLGGASGDNNGLTGAGTVTLDGDFVIDTTAADALASGTWTLEDVTTSTYGSTFSVVGFTPIGGDKWEKPVGLTKKYTFDETTGTLTLGASASYASWAAVNAIGSTPEQDKDGDGVSNAVEYLLGGDVNTNDLDKLPTVDASGTDLVFTFKRDRDSIDGSTTAVIEVGTTLATWPGVFNVGATTAGSTAGVTVLEDSPSGFDTITLTVPKAPDAAKFARLNVTVVP